MSALQHDYNDLIRLFNERFSHSHQTELVRGDDEPLYVPPGKHGSKGQIIFAHGYFSSALHEIAHWCIAGEKRRQQEDYGYWYIPDGRNPDQQRAFEHVEVKPQALEWLFSIACNYRFVFSADNLDSTGENASPSADFQAAVRQQLAVYVEGRLPNERARAFRDDLIKFYGTCAHYENTKQSLRATLRHAS